MYDDHYGLSGRPFQLTPDARFWFDTATHRKAMAYLGYGLSQGEGFVVITGDPGAGKTTLMGHLLAGIDRERLNVITIVSSQIGADDLLRLVAQGLGVSPAGLSKGELLGAIERGLHTVARSGRRSLLVVDEAQALPVDSLEELRLLSNFQAGGYPLLQIFLLGQPEFRLTLADPKLEQLRQRVIAMHHLEPMDAAEVEPYVVHRLTCVGWQGKPGFTADALAGMHRWSGGIPRRLNQLAGRVMLFGAVEGIETLGRDEVAAVIADLEGDTLVRAAARVAQPEPPGTPAPLPMGAPTPPVEPVAPAAEIADPEPVAEIADPEPETIEPEAIEGAAEGESASEDAAPDAPAVEPEPAPAEDRQAALERRLDAMEAHLKEQDEALRRVLRLLIDWVESADGGNRPDLSTIRETAA